MAGLTSALEIAAKLKSVYDDGKHLELLETVNLLRKHLVDVKEEVLALRGENLKLAEDNAQLRTELAKRETQGSVPLVLEGQVWIEKGADGKQVGGPFCPNCLNLEDKKVTLTHVHGANFRCSKCEGVFRR